MRIIICELKKIWNIKILGIIIVMCALFYLSFVRYHLEWYPRFFGVELAHHLAETYGTTLSLEDFEDFLNYRDVIVADLNLFIASRPIFAQAGIYNFEDYEDFRHRMGEIYDTQTYEQRRLWIDIALEWGSIVRTEINGETIDISSENEAPIAYTRMMDFNNIIGMYQSNILGTEWLSTIDSFIEWHTLSEREKQRLVEIRDSGELTSILTQGTLYHTRTFGRNLAILAILVTLILVSSLITTDRANRVNWLQYSSKQGRSVLAKQFSAIVISAIGVTTILMVVFVGIFSTLRTWVFWNNGINSFLGWPFHWLSITYGQYVLFIIGIIYSLSIGTAVFAFTLSRFSQNMVRLMFKVIPFFVVTQMLSNWVLTDFLGIYIGGDIFIQMLSLMMAFVMVVIVATFVLQREKRSEL